MSNKKFLWDLEKIKDKKILVRKFWSADSPSWYTDSWPYIVCRPNSHSWYTISWPYIVHRPNSPGWYTNSWPYIVCRPNSPSWYTVSWPYIVCRPNSPSWYTDSWPYIVLPRVEPHCQLPSLLVHWSYRGKCPCNAT